MAAKEGAKCYDCGKSFYSRKQLVQHSQDRHTKVNNSGMMMKPFKKPLKLPKKLITIVGVVALRRHMSNQDDELCLASTG
jgi:hypothetical protein